MTGIYLIKNKVNGKCYVGQAMDIEERWKQHIAAAKKPKMYISRAIAKYGADNFDFSVVELCSAEKLNEREIIWIEKLDTYNNGYNCTIGGDGRNQGKDSYSTDYHRAKVKAYCESHTEKVRATKKAYREAHKDDPEYKMKRRAAKKAYRNAHPDKVSAANKAYREENKDKVKEYQKAYRDANKEYFKKYYEAHKFTPTPDHTEMPLW